MSNITAVTFDLWQTLLIDDRDLGRARARLRIQGAQQVLRETGIEFSEEHIREAYRQCYHTCHAVREQERDVSFMKQVAIFIEHIDYGLLRQLGDATFERIATLYADSFYDYPPMLHSCAASVLGELKRQGYRLGLISNTGMTPGVTFRVFMEQLGILGYFDTLTFSDEAQLAKPAVEIFHRTTKALNASPEETVHIGDHLLNDVMGAHNAGVQTIWVRGFDDSEAEVEPDVTIDNLQQVGDALATLQAHRAT